MVSSVRAFALIAGAWLRASLTYRTSFVITTIGQLLVTVLDFVGIVIIFSHIDRFGGFTLSQIALLYGVSGLGIGFADLLVGNSEQLGRRVRDGTLDSMLVRPVAPLVQVCADRFALRRVGRIIQVGVVTGWALVNVDVSWSAAKVAVLILAVVSGTVIFCSVFILGSAYQFIAGDASEVMNAFTYGGNTLTQYPLTIYPAELVKGLTFVLPMAFVNWYPVLYVLGRTDPFGLPSWLQLASPLAAAVMAGLATLGWRAGLHRYQSTGS
ncbi:MAG: ABC transporter permease [Nocardioidaceae bacterium]